MSDCERVAKQSGISEVAPSSLTAGAKGVCSSVLLPSRNESTPHVTTDIRIERSVEAVQAQAKSKAQKKQARKNRVKKLLRKVKYKAMTVTIGKF